VNRYVPRPGLLDTGQHRAAPPAVTRSGSAGLFFIPLFLLAVPLYSQTTGELTGVVSEESGRALVGASIAIESPALISPQKSQVSDQAGRFTFPALPIGAYQVTVELEGYASQQVEDVEVVVKKTTHLQVRLSPSTIRDQINVTSRTPVVDPNQTSLSQVFDLEYLETGTIGSINRDYLEVVKQSPGVVDSVLCADTIDPNVLGSMDNENLYVLDGANMTLPENMTWGKIVNFDAIEQISIETAGYRAEYGTTTGGMISVVTKSGGNSFAGTVDLRYRSSDWAENGEHFDRDREPTHYGIAAGTLGGPILADRLWFFLAADTRESTWTPDLALTTRKFEGYNFLGKLTWQPRPSWTFISQLITDPVTIHNYDASPWVEPEASQSWEQGGPLTRVNLDGVLSRNLLWNLGGSTFRGDIQILPESGDLETIGHYEFAPSGLYSINAAEHRTIDRSRDELSTNLSIAAGIDHFVKVGGSYAAESQTDEWRLVTGYQYQDWFGKPYGLLSVPPEGPYTLEGDHLGGFVQDTWRILPSLNLYLGMRWDGTTQVNNVGSRVADLSQWQPRLGLSWQITRDGKTVARASWGRFMQPNTLQLASLGRDWKQVSEFYYLSCSNFGLTREECRNRFGGRVEAGNRVIDTWIPDPGGLWDPNGFWLSDWHSGAQSGVEIIPGLDPMYSQQLVLGIEREFAQRSSVELSYIDKAAKDLFEDTCSGNLPEPFAGADCHGYTVANLPFLERTYQAWMLRVQSHAKSWLRLFGSYTWAKSLGNVESRGDGYDFDSYPDHWQNRYGYLGDDRRHRLRLNGYFLLPSQTAIAFGVAWMSEYPYTVVEPVFPYGDRFHEPRGSRRAAAVHWIDLQLSKSFSMGPTSLTLIGTILNVLGQEQVTRVCDGYYGCEIEGREYELDDPMFFMQPRHYELGVRMTF